MSTLINTSTSININDGALYLTTMDNSSLFDDNITGTSDVFSTLITSINTSYNDYLPTPINDTTFVTDFIQSLLDIMPKASVTTTPVHPDVHVRVAMETNDDDVDIQVLVYVFAVVMFYGLILVIALMGVRIRKHRVIQIEDDYAALIDCSEVVRIDTTLRQKMNVLRLNNVQNGYMLDMIPEHDV